MQKAQSEIEKAKEAKRKEEERKSRKKRNERKKKPEKAEEEARGYETGITYDALARYQMTILVRRLNSAVK